jgi:hydroxymethylpyrimidine/phosphomethylpyrimidine kinase
MTIPRVLVIAGSDSGGGAGIQADIKTVMALGGHAMTAITAITAQSTLGVTQALTLEPGLVIAQIDAVLADIGADAIKIGMIGSPAVAEAVADRLARDDARMPLVFDPVMVSTSGSALADPATIAAFERLMARAALITPNLPELEVLAGPAADPAIAALALARRTGAAVLAKGGHGEGAELVDRLVDADGVRRAWRDARIETRHTHGTGCTLASAIATGLAAGLALEAAVAQARDLVRAAILAAPRLGGGNGPLGHAAVWPLTRKAAAEQGVA